jgi:hypothetical protein
MDFNVLHGPGLYDVYGENLRKCTLYEEAGKGRKTIKHRNCGRKRSLKLRWNMYAHKDALTKSNQKNLRTSIHVRQTCVPKLWSTLLMSSCL